MEHEIMMNTKKTKYNLLQVIVRIIPIQVRSAPWNCLLENCLGVMHGLLFALSVVATQYLLTRFLMEPWVKQVTGNVSSG